MHAEERALFKKALIQAFSQKFEDELTQCQETALCSDEHKEAMEKILSQSKSKPEGKASSKKRIIIGLLLAAALLLIGCTAYILRDEIGDFMEEIFQKHIRLTYNGEEESHVLEKITTDYELSYMPDGYTLSQESYSPSGNYLIWENTESDIIIFEQYPLDGANFMLDAEIGTTNIIEHETFDIYCRENTDFSYIWSDGNYSYKIISNVPLPESTILRIIDGMRVKEE